MTSFLRTLESERIKLSTTASTCWLLAGWVAAALVVAFFTRQAVMAYPDAEAVASSYLSGVLMPGILFIMLILTMAVTADYRCGMNAATALANPKPWQVAAAKYLVGAVPVVVLGEVLLLAAPLVGYGTSAGPGYPQLDPAFLAALWRVPVVVALLAAMCQGVALMVRSTASSLGIWVLAAMAFPLLGSAGEAGATLYRYTPIYNVSELLGLQSLGPSGSTAAAVCTLCVWAAGLWVVGVAVERYRDA